MGKECYLKEFPNMFTTYRGKLVPTAIFSVPFPSSSLSADKNL